jgi:hypothetical protein
MATSSPVIEFSQFPATGDGVLPMSSFEWPGAFYTNQKVMVLVEITPRETYRKLAGFLPSSAGQSSVW